MAQKNSDQTQCKEKANQGKSTHVPGFATFLAVNMENGAGHFEYLRNRKAMIERTVELGDLLIAGG